MLSVQLMDVIANPPASPPHCNDVVGKHVDHPDNCGVWYVCQMDPQGVWTVDTLQCPTDLAFDLTLDRCEYTVSGCP